MPHSEIVILGAGFGGLEAATLLAEQLPPTFGITLIDKNDHFIIGFSKFEVMFGRFSAEQVKAYYADLAAPRVRFVRDTVTAIDPAARTVRTSRADYTCDWLIVALGADVEPALTPGFAEGGHEFYTLAGADRLYPVLDRFTGGTILLSILGMPYKCPPAPFEAAFQLHDFFTERGLRDRVTLRMLIPGAVPLPVAPGAADEINRRFAERGIDLLTRHQVTALDPAARHALVDGHAPVPYDLFIGVPLHRPPQVVRESALGGKGWIRVDRATLRTAFPNVYAVGDVTAIPVGDGAVPKAGAFAESAARTVVGDIVHRLTGAPAPPPYEAVGTCYLEFGEGNVAQISANYLGGDAPQVALEQPSAELRADKQHFLDDRIGRWFGGGRGRG